MDLNKAKACIEHYKCSYLDEYNDFDDYEFNEAIDFILDLVNFIEFKKHIKEECKYCDKGFAMSENNRDELGIELHAGESKLIAYGLDKYGWDISIETKINYCPICGRKLGGLNE